MQRILASNFLAVLLLPSLAVAQSTWDGGAGTSSWGDVNNWNPNSLPSPTADLLFTGIGSYTINLGTSRSANALSFSGNTGYSLQGSSLSLTSGNIITNSPSSGTVTHTISSNLNFTNAGISTAANSTLSLDGITIGLTLAKSGAGTLVLGGSTGFSGGATVSAGTLQIGNGTSGSLTGNITNNANVSFLANTQSTYSGVISGSGSLTKYGGATLVLTGANTFTGGISIAGGNIDIGGGTSTGSVTSNINSIGVTIFNRTTDSTYSGILSGTGSVYKVNSGTLTLSGANTYTGNLHLEGGLLNFSSTSLGASSTIRLSGGGLQWSTGNTTDISNRTITIDSGGATFDTNGNDVTFANAIGNNGTGGLTKAGSGTLTLSGTNTYQGTTTVSAGTLKLTNSNAVPGNIVNNAAVTYADDGTYSSNMSGSGSLRLDYAGFITLAGDYTHTGGTTVAQGIAGLGTGSILGNIAVTSSASGTRFQFNQSDAITYSGILSGIGEVRMAGTGTLTLTGNSTMTGTFRASAGTTEFSSLTNLGTGTISLSGGTLRWAEGSSADISTRTISVEAAGGVLDTNGNDVRLANSIGIGGSITKSGEGILTFVNGLAANLTIAAGEAVLGEGTFPSTSKTISNNSYLTINQTGSTTLSGVISGSGSLTKMSSGTAILTGANTFSGGTTITAGSLQIGDGGTTGSISGNIVNNATLAFNRSDNLTFSGIISGSGTVTKSGTGTLTVTGVSTHSGGTTINAGVLQIGDGSAAGFIPGNIVNNATLTFNRSDNLPFTGIVSGTGALVKSGTGTLILTGANTYTGGTTISAGTLQLGNGGSTGSISGNVVNDGTLAFKRSDNLTFSGLISGSGSLSKLGSATLTLTRANTFTGGSIVNAGVLQLGDGTVSNAGALISKAGVAGASLPGSPGGDGAAGGTAVSVASAGSLIVTTSSSVTGGRGGEGGAGSTGGTGGDGGNAVEMSQGSSVTNSGTITAGGGNNGASASASGGAGGYGGSGGSGVSGAGSLTNTGAIVGGFAGYGATGGSGQRSGNGGYGGTGGDGVNLDAYSSFTNSGTITGGNGGAGGNAGNGEVINTGPGNGGTGGTGVVIGNYSTLTNSGTISGGNGGNGSSFNSKDGAGGVGVSLGNGSIFTNTGIIAGGNPGNTSGTNKRPGGVGLVASGDAQLITSGSIRGGIGPVTLVRADAVNLSGGGNSLTLQNGFSFIGNVISNSGTTNGGDTLALGGTIDSSFNVSNIVSALPTSYSGTPKYYGFTNYEKTGSNKWILTGNGNQDWTIDSGVLEADASSLQGDVVLSNPGNLSFNQSGSGIYAGMISGSGSLTKLGSGTLTMTNASTYSGGTQVNAGTLATSHSNGVGTGAVTVSAGGTLLVEAEAAAFSNEVILAGGSYNRELAAGTNLAGKMSATSSFADGSPDTTAEILGGQTSTLATLQSSFSGTSTALNDDIRVSDTFSLSGIPVVNGSGQTDTFVLQLSFLSSTSDRYLAWLNPETNLWVNAVDGNFGNNPLYSDQAFDGSFLSFQDLHGTDLSQYIGAWGSTSDNGVVSTWAVLNHNSEFSAIPEPSAALLVLLGVGGLALRRKRSNAGSASSEGNDARPIAGRAPAPVAVRDKC